MGLWPGGILSRAGGMGGLQGTEFPESYKAIFLQFLNQSLEIFKMPAVLQHGPEKQMSLCTQHHLNYWPFLVT